MVTAARTMENFVAIVRRPARNLAESCELTFLERSPISCAALERQHAAYREALAAAGAEVVVLDAIDALPDSVFVEDTAVVLDELAIQARPGAVSRQLEPAQIASTLARFRRCEAIVAPGTLEGGDVLPIGRTLYVGLSTRTDRAGIEQFDARLRPYGYRVVPVRVHGSLHLKTACAALDAETLLLNPAWVDSAAFDGFARIEVADDEAFAANVLPIGHARLIDASYPRTRERVETFCARAGLRAIAVDISEFGKAEAGLTCMSLVFASPAFERRPGDAA